jgi:hypothetical protein
MWCNGLDESEDYWKAFVKMKVKFWGSQNVGRLILHL